MDKANVLKVLKELKEKNKKRAFTQSYDFIINIKGIDLKKSDNQIEFFTNLPHDKGKASKVCALVGPELKDEANKVCQKHILVDDFDKYAKDKKLTKKLANEFNFFIAQANVMAKVASAFGKIFGPRKKMPNPKAGCVVSPKATLKPLFDKLQKLIKVSFKTGTSFKCTVGNEKMSDDDIAENIVSLYKTILSHLPAEKNNIRSVLIKFSMGAPMRLR